MEMPEITRAHTHFHTHQVQVGAQIRVKTCFTPHQWAQHAKEPLPSNGYKHSDWRWRMWRSDENTINHAKPHPFSAKPGRSWGPNARGHLPHTPPADSAHQKNPTLKVLCKNSDWGWRMRRIDGDTRNPAKSLEITPMFSHIKCKLRRKYTWKTCFAPHQWIQHLKKPYL